MNHDRFCPLAAKTWRPSRSTICQCLLINEVRNGIRKDLLTIAEAMKLGAADNSAEGASESNAIHLEIKALTYEQAAKVVSGKFKRVGFPSA